MSALKLFAEFLLQSCFEIPELELQSSALRMLIPCAQISKQSSNFKTVLWDSLAKIQIAKWSGIWSQIPYSSSCPKRPKRISKRALNLGPLNPYMAAGGKFLQVIRGNLAQFPSEIVGNQRQIDAEQRKRPKFFACGGRKQRKSIKTLDWTF